MPKNLDLGRVFFAGFGPTVQCSTTSPIDCTVVHGHKRHILLMGDSNAEMLVPAFESMARAQGLTLSLEITAGCPWQRDIYALTFAAIQPLCHRNKADAYRRVIPALRPDIIVLVNANGLDVDASVEDLTRSALALLKAPGRKLILVDPIVETPFPPEPLDCLRRAHFLEDCRFVAHSAPRPIDQLYQSLAGAEPSVIPANFDRLVCPYLPICDPVIGGIVVRWDHQHIATAYSASIGPALTAYFKNHKLLPQ